ncbi:hypothetical protein [Victivallis vadensis]|jgi:hypothetical protein|uniref:SnoaL-like protein n=1 Tax=Victivallis vadensis TaxID=172901 RepID=A0A2U1ASG3_9BACT|nr:hypothetical protein [Victivallis vadensis]PVY39342.1 hypothetical protein C8D82_12116 [Victivallis vadensis]PWM79145.1 MAG: hypothetical protein DBX90_09325 [Lentisphaerota bacterium]HJH05286.1 hypothetical protein [Victivallis vadensis]
MTLRLQWWHIAVPVLILVLGGLSFWYLNRNTDEAEIRLTLKQLCSVGSKAEGESAAAGAIKLQRSNELFTDPCRLDFRHSMFQGDFSVSEIAANIARFRMLFQTVQIEIRDLHITVTPPDGAQVYFTGLLDGVARNGEQVGEVRDLFCKLKKVDGKWRISEMNIREVLEK